MTKISDYLNIATLAAMPAKMTGRQVGFIQGAKGETAFLNVNEASQTVMVVEMLPGIVRGGHHHVGKQEWAYIIEGEVDFYCWMPETPEQVEIKTLQKSDLIHIKPGLGHAFLARTRTLVLEQSDAAYQPEQTIIATHLPKQLR